MICPKKIDCKCYLSFESYSELASGFLVERGLLLV